MKFVVMMLAVVSFGTQAVARNVVERDSSGAWMCKNAGGEVVAYYQPFGRVPTQQEQLDCQTAGGRVQAPTKPAKAPAEKVPEGKAPAN